MTNKYSASGWFAVYDNNSHYKENIMSYAPYLLLAAVLISMLIRTPYAMARRKVPIASSQNDRQEKAMLILVTTGVMVLPILYIGSSWFHFADYPSHPALIWAGAALLLPFLFLFWRSHADLGTNWSVTLELCENQTLITRGVYRYMRHPMYAAMWLWTLAQALLISNWLIGPAGLISFGIMYLLRVPREEAMMLRQFGDEYRRYMDNTPRVFFKISRA
jgi:protein-S-isoprenylcysteine O-methyltransferase Ste14